jgi:hypothetical protein
LVNPFRIAAELSRTVSRVRLFRYLRATQQDIELELTLYEKKTSFRRTTYIRQAEVVLGQGGLACLMKNVQKLKTLESMAPEARRAFADFDKRNSQNGLREIAQVLPSK